MNIRTSDLLVGSMIGAAGGLNGIALPGLLLVGLGFDVSMAIAYRINPAWFPGGDGLGISDILTTAAGTTAGWMVAKAIAPQGNPRLAPIAAAGMLLLPGRAPGRMRHATYRWSR